MDSHDSGIDEKLVPFVEGALAEADRREVLQALPQQPALNQEVKQLREIIMTLRNQSASGLTYRSPVEAPADQVVDFAQQGEQWSRTAARQFQLQLLESPGLAEEIAILRELEQELQLSAEAPASIPEMPASLRSAIQEAYGRSAPEPAWKKSFAAIFAWVATLNVRLVGAAVAGVTVVVAGIGFGRYAHQQLGTPAATVGMATPHKDSKATASPAPSAQPAPASSGQQVALLKDKVLPEDLPHLSRLLWEKQVSHTYRDGQIFVAQNDIERAWAALNLNEKVADATPLKTKPAPSADDKKNPLAGMVSMAPESVRKKSEPAPGSTRQNGGSAAPSRPKPAVALADSETAPAAASEPAAARPAPEAPSETFDANYNVLEDQRRYERAPVSAPARPAAPPVTRPPVAITRPAPPAPPPQPAPSTTEEPVVAPPVQQMRQAPAQMYLPQQPQPRDSNREGQGIGSIMRGPSQPQNRAASNPPQNEPEPAIASLPPAAQPAGGLPESEIESKGSRSRNDEESEPPAPGQVAMDSGGEEEPKPNPVSLKVRASKANPLPSGNAAPAVEGRMRPVPKLQERDRSQKADGFGMSNSDFEVSGDAPYEVAMLPVAKKLVEDQIGEAKVQMERKDDGHLLITIRPARTLTPQEIEKLRKFVRKKLELKDEDTVVIRQP